MPEREKIASVCDQVIGILLIVFIIFLPMGRAVNEVCVGLIGSAWVVRRIALKNYKIPLTHFHLAMIAFVASLILSSIFSFSPKNSINELVSYLDCFILFFPTCEYLNSEKRMKKLFLAFILSATVQGLNGIYQYLNGVDFFRHYPLIQGRVTASFPQPTHVGLLSMMVPFGIAYLELDKPNLRRILLLLGILSVCATLVLSLTRNSWVGLLCGIAVMLLFTRRKKVYIATIAILLLSLLLLAPPKTCNRLLSILDFSSNPRVLLWQTSWKMFKDAPVVGQGIDTFSELFFKFIPPKINTNKKFIPSHIHPHNIYLESLAERGIVGFITMIYLFFLLARYCYLINKQKVSNLSYVFALGLSGSLTVYLVQAIAGWSFYRYWYSSFFWIMAAMILSLKYLPKIETASNPQKKSINKFTRR